MIATFCAIYGLMASSAYLAYRTTLQDLGVYDRGVWALSIVRPFPYPRDIVWALGHFSPVMVVHALLYKVWPSGHVLLWSQVIAVGLGAYPVYRLAQRRLGSEAGLVFAAAYLLYPPVVFTVLFDFHPDHLLIPLLLWAFYLLDRGRWGSLVAVCVVMLLVKESLGPTVVAFGAYAVAVRWRRLLERPIALVGTTLGLAAVAVFVVVIVRSFEGVFDPGIAGGVSYGYLGSDLPTIVRTAILSPGTWLPELAQIPKLKFVFLMLAPLAFLPLFGPPALVAAIPGLVMSLLSRSPHRYQIWAQYTAPIIPPLFAATIDGYRRLVSHRLGRKLLPSADLQPLALFCLLGASVYGNVVFSPSPASTVFWLGYPEQHRWRYHLDAYRVTDRERRIRRALEQHVPASPYASVSTQNSVNSSHLAHRWTFEQFPNGIEWADRVVIDLRRPQYVGDMVDPIAFSGYVERVTGQRLTVYESDGFFIFGPLLQPEM